MSIDLNRIKRANLSTCSTGDTSLFIHSAHKSRRNQHGRTFSLGFHCPTTAGTAITDGIKTPQHGVLKKGVMNVPPFILLFKNPHCLF
jgi:hypothetical protein